MSDDDLELVERVQQGDQEAVAQLYRRTRGWLLQLVIVPRVGRHLADDVLAETFATALDKVGDFRWRGVGVLHWLAAIARRKCQEAGRRRLRSAARESPLDPLLEPPDPVPTREAELVRLAARDDLRQRVAATLDRLRPRYAEALRLRLLEGLARGDCAARLGVSPTTFDVVLHRAARAFARVWRNP